jgi:hypothetical protein
MRQGRVGGCTGRQWEESSATGAPGGSEVQGDKRTPSDFCFIFPSRLTE